MSSEEGQKHIYAQEYQLYYYYNNFKGVLTLTLTLFFRKTTTLKWLQTIYSLAISQPAKMYFSPLICLF